MICPPQRILVADDDPSIRQVTRTMLKRAGYEVDEAEDGAVAWVALNTECYDLLITDNNMPNVTGIELLKMLRAARLDMPVIMATANPPEEEFRHHPWLEPRALLVKPYEVKTLLQAVKTVLRAANHTRLSSPAPRNLITPVRTQLPPLNPVLLMEPNPVLQWCETAPGIWTPLPETEPSSRKGPARKIISLDATLPPPGNHRQPRKPRIPPKPPAAARR